VPSRPWFDVRRQTAGWSSVMTLDVSPEGTSAWTSPRWFLASSFTATHHDDERDDAASLVHWCGGCWSVRRTLPDRSRWGTTHVTGCVRPQVGRAGSTAGTAALPVVLRDPPVAPPEETGTAAQRPGSVTEGTSCSVIKGSAGRGPAAVDNGRNRPTQTGRRPQVPEESTPPFSNLLPSAAHIHVTVQTSEPSRGGKDGEVRRDEHDGAVVAENSRAGGLGGDVSGHVADLAQPASRHGAKCGVWPPKPAADAAGSGCQSPECPRSPVTRRGWIAPTTGRPTEA
jgi:hypothetical protein